MTFHSVMHGLRVTEAFFHVSPAQPLPPTGNPDFCRIPPTGNPDFCRIPPTGNPDFCRLGVSLVTELPPDNQSQADGPPRSPSAPPPPGDATVPQQCGVRVCTRRASGRASDTAALPSMRGMKDIRRRRRLTGPADGPGFCLRLDNDHRTSAYRGRQVQRSFDCDTGS